MRAARRRQTESGIIEAARELFADLGFGRTTIRAVASRAGVDPALVMQYFGNKEGLFAAAAQWHVDRHRLADAPLEAIPRIALDDLFTNFHDAHRRDSAIALLRNCLTHDHALRVVLNDVINEPQTAIARTIGGEDAELRAALLGSTIMGLILARYLLEIPSVTTASQEQIEAIMVPALRVLLDEATSPSG